MSAYVSTHEPAHAGPPLDERPRATNIALIGFMAAGKSTVGRLLADTLGWSFLDFDEEIVRREGRPIAQIFRESGEAAFREMESRLTAGLSSVRRTVLAPGGGWVLRPDNPQRLPPGTRTVWLRVSAEEAVRRARAAGTDRPLLDSADDAIDAARRLLASREPLYARADLTLDVEGRTPAQIVTEITRNVRTEE